MSTYLNVSISLDPYIELPFENNESYYGGHESQDLLTMANSWLLNLRNKLGPKRGFVAFGENLHGQSVLLCKYLRPLKPPKELCDLDSPEPDRFAIEKCARFVSMVPFLSDLKMFDQMPDMYSTCQEFLDLGGGDYEEHAILLANYFQYIDNKQSPGKYKSYIVYGYAMPEGRSVYVMRVFADQSEKKDFELWSPITGESFFYK